MFVFVTNKNDFPHVDRYNGKDYVFEPGHKQMVPHDAAAHMFGFGRIDKTENLVRLGWANRLDDEGVKWLAKFVFTDAKVVEDDEMTVAEEGAAARVDTPMQREEPPAARAPKVLPSSGINRPPLAAAMNRNA